MIEEYTPESLTFPGWLFEAPESFVEFCFFY